MQLQARADASSQGPAERDRERGLPAGLPHRLRAGVESLSGISLDGVRVHYDSPEPARVHALAYTRGNDIHIGPQQERHLPHEAWHVVQQHQGRVTPTAHAGGVAINDDPALEREADRMGALAARGASDSPRAQSPSTPSTTAVVQRVAGLVKVAARKLTFDKLVWGGFADHFGDEKKYMDKAASVVESGKAKHTVFAVDGDTKTQITENLINQNIKKNGWMDSQPGTGEDFTVSPQMSYVTYELKQGKAALSDAGNGYPVVRVQPDTETLEEATGDKNGAGVTYYSPFHLQGIAK